MKTSTTAFIAAATSTAVAVVLACIFYKRMKQSIKGTFTESFFSIDELCTTSTGLPNTPNEQQRQSLQALIDNVLNPVRHAYGSYIKVNSGFRSPAVNAKVGGAANSQHTTGQAADITGGSIANNRKIWETIVKNGKYDQLIWEKGGQWIHVSHRTGSNRAEMLSYNGSSYTNINNRWQNAILA